MTDLTFYAIGLVAFLHVLFALGEGFFWDVLGPRLLRTSDQGKIDLTRPLAQNQGVYNAFLAAGLIWSLKTGDTAVATFFLICVAIAGLVGGLTASRLIFVVQSLPALFALYLVWS